MSGARPAEDAPTSTPHPPGTSPADPPDVPAPRGGLPGMVAAAWGVRERAHRGPKPALTTQRIIEAAMRLADADGLDAISMGRVAAELGAAPMSLYRHVSAKEELLELMADAAWGSPPDPPAPSEGWRAGLSRWAWAMRANGRRHRWVARIPVGGLPVLPHQVAWFEQALAHLKDSALTEARKGSVILLLSGYVRHQVSTETDIEAAIRASGLDPSQWMSGYAGMLRRLTGPQQFPALAAFTAAGAFDIADAPDDEFTFGLTRILDGIELLIQG